MSRVGRLVYLLWGNVSFWQEALAENSLLRRCSLLDAALSTAAGTVGRPSPTLALSTPPRVRPRRSDPEDAHEERLRRPLAPRLGLVPQLAMAATELSLKQA